jgi:hypothetical protein
VDTTPVFTAEYLGDSIWSVNKICRDNPQASDYWYFYEDTGKLLGNKLTTPTNGAMQGTITTDDNKLYHSIRDYTRRAYITTLELKFFNWQRLTSLNLVPEGSGESKGTDAAAELLPSRDFVAQLMTQCDKCHALAIRIWAENPYLELNATEDSKDGTTAEKWSALSYQFDWEISKTEEQVQTLKSDANQMFDKAEEYLSQKTASIQSNYLNELRNTRGKYIDKLEQVSLYLEQAREANWKLRCHALNIPTATN